MPRDLFDCDRFRMNDHHNATVSCIARSRASFVTGLALLLIFDDLEHVTTASILDSLHSDKPLAV
jgi:hypothetical protein